MSLSLVNVLLVAFSGFFALNMGGAGFSPSFSAALGAKLIPRVAAHVVFGLCVGIGALTIGGHVAQTLGTGFVPPGTIDRQAALVLVSSASGALFIANLARTPESTSWVTVFSIVSLGLYRHNLTWHTILYRLLPAWLAVPPLAMLLTWLLARQLYPLRGWNYRLYENLTKHEWKLRALVIVSSGYLAIAVGANNVANVVAPLATAGVFSVRTGMAVFAPVFALGGVVFFRLAKTVGSDVVPLGLYSATIINLVVGTMVLVISWLGVPQSLVFAQLLAVFGIAVTKDGSYELVRHRVVRRIARFWIVSPVVAFVLVAIQLVVLDWVG